ncbi:MAG: alpha/beta fold hydrolase [Bacteroidota bacterium]
MKIFLSKFTITILLLFYSCAPASLPILSTSDNIYSFSTEDRLTDSIHIQKIEQIFNNGNAGFFEGKNGVSIFYNYFLQDSLEKGAIIISDGRTEAVVKYKEVIYDLYQNGYSVYIHDHRGQGFSGRMTEDPDMGYVDNFQNYIDDLKYFYNNFVIPHNHEKKFLLAHSMGGAIAATYIEQFPNDFNATAFSSPMLGLPFPTCPVIKIIGGDEPKYALGNTDYTNSIAPFEENELTNSNIRYQLMLDTFKKYPKARLGGASYQWVDKSCNQFEIIFNNLEQIETPLILFSGGEESIVDASAHNDFIDELKSFEKTAKGYFVNGAKHELLIEKDAVRISVLAKILEFFSEN